VSPAVSVVVPVYDVEDYLEEALRSVLDQSLADIEVICVDDGSTDGSAAILDRLAEADGRLRVIRQENRGLGAARNAGARAARGDRLYFFDSDDLLAPGALTRLVEVAAGTQADIVYFDAAAFTEDPELEPEAARMSGYYRRSGSYPGAAPGPELFRDMQAEGDWRPSACLQLFDRAWYELSGLAFPEGVLHEDNLFSVQAALAARRAAHVPEPLFQRRMRPGSITTTAKSIAHLRGLLYCARELTRLAMDPATSEVDRPGVLAVVGEVHGQALGVYEQLGTPTAELIERSGLGAEEIAVLPVYDRLVYVRNRERKRRKAAEQQLRQLQSSRGYRLVTFPRRLLRLVRGRSAS